MRSRYAFLQFVLFVCAPPCLAQVMSEAKVHDVVFRVVDAPTGTPLSGVIVINPTSRLAASTDQEGELPLRASGSGTLILEFAKVGYRQAVFVMFVERAREILVELTPRVVEVPASGWSVEGVVTDAGTGAPLEEVLITGSLPELSAVSGSMGEFSLGRLPPGRLRLVFRRLGYADREVTLETEEGRHVDLRVEMPGEPIALGPVAVTVDRRSVAGKVDTQRLGASTVITEFGAAQDVAEVLQWYVPGVQVFRGPTGRVSVQIRGMASLTNQGQPLVILDGMPVDSASVSWTLQRIHPSQVERIEVLRDVASTAVYGTRGAHGVVLIDLKRR